MLATFPEAKALMTAMGIEFEAFDEYKKLRRRSSADTYKDISDIEDFECDDIH